MISTKLKKIGKNIRINILKRTYKAKSSHIGSCLSIVEILIAIYFQKLIKNSICFEQRPWVGFVLYFSRKKLLVKNLNTYEKIILF